MIPPGIGIVHQVNLEYLAKGVLSQSADGQELYYPDTLVGTDSHTTMINGLGVVGWGVGGIEAEAGMLGQPVYFLTPEVVGVNLTGRLREGVTATDLALHVTELLRKTKVVGKFVEFYGEGAASLPLPDRATIANMAPEYGATMGYFPVDSESVNYLRGTGRTDAQCAAFEAYFRAQQMFGMPRAGDIDYSTDLELDLASVQPGVAGPKRPQDRIDLPDLKTVFSSLLEKPVADTTSRPPRAANRRKSKSSPRDLKFRPTKKSRLRKWKTTGPRRTMSRAAPATSPPPSTTAVWSSPRSPAARTQATQVSCLAPGFWPRRPSSAGSMCLPR